MNRLLTVTLVLLLSLLFLIALKITLDAVAEREDCAVTPTECVLVVESHEHNAIRCVDREAGAILWISDVGVTSLPISGELLDVEEGQ